MSESTRHATSLQLNQPMERQVHEDIREAKEKSMEEQVRERLLKE